MSLVSCGPEGSVNRWVKDGSEGEQRAALSVALRVWRPGSDGNYFSDVTGHQKGGNLRSCS